MVTNDAWEVRFAFAILYANNLSGCDMVLAAMWNKLMHALYGNSPDSAPPSVDPWLERDPWQQALAQRKVAKPKAKPVTSKWEDLQIPHMDELQPDLTQLAMSDLQPEGKGVVLATLPSVDRHKWVRSQQALCLIVPGQDREDLQSLLITGDLGSSAAVAGELTIRDPLKEKARDADQLRCHPCCFRSFAY